MRYKTVGTVIGILTAPIIVLNMLGGIIAGVWLAFLGEWRLIILGILLVFTAHIYLSILLLLSLPLDAIGMYLYKKDNIFRHVFLFLSQFYTNLLIVGTCAFAYFVCLYFCDGESKIGMIPYMLWSWGMALGPWQYFQSHERDNEYSAIDLFSATIFYFLFLISNFMWPLISLIVLICFVLVQLFILPIYMTVKRLGTTARTTFIL